VKDNNNPGNLSEVQKKKIKKILIALMYVDTHTETIMNFENPIVKKGLFKLAIIIRKSIMVLSENILNNDFSSDSNLVHSYALDTSLIELNKIIGDTLPSAPKKIILNDLQNILENSCSTAGTDSIN